MSQYAFIYDFIFASEKATDSFTNNDEKLTAFQAGEVAPRVVNTVHFTDA